MSRILLFILLITVVYSWEEFKYTILAIWSKIRKQKPNFEKNTETDGMVSDIVVIATIPFSLAYLLLAPAALGQKLLVITLAILVVGLILKGIEEYHWRKHFTRHYEGSDKFVAMAFSLLGLISPTWHFATRAIPGHKTHLGKYLMTLLIPLVLGLSLVLAVHNLSYEAFQSQLDQLIIIATLGLLMNLTIEVLEHFFRVYRLHLFSLIRILLGIVIIFALQI